MNHKLLLLAFAALTFAATKDKFKLPPPMATPSAKNPSKVIAQPGGTNLQVPAGFTVEEWAKGFQKPRYMLQLATGPVLVTDSIPNGTIYAIRADGNRTELITKLERPSGIAVHDGYLYVAEAQSIKRYKLDEGELKVGEGKEIISFKGYEKGHWARSITFGADGKMYVAVGSGSNVDTGDPANRAAVNIYNPDGSGAEIMAGGLRNPVRIRFHPVSKKLWAAVQERDGLGDDLVPDFFTQVDAGAFYGWPFAYIGPNEEPRHKGENMDLVKKTKAPTTVLQPHAAVMDFLFYTGSQFPERYKNGAFLTYHGSSNRAKRLGYSVVFQPFKGGKPNGPIEDFMTGWMLGADKEEVWGRPVGLLQMNDGSLLVSEDGNNKIWHIHAKK